MHQFETSIIPWKVSSAAMLLFVLAMPQHLTAASPPKGAICSTAIATSDFTPYVIPAGTPTAELDYIVSNSVGPDKGLVCHIETYTCGYESKVYPPVLATVTVTDGGGIVLFSDTQTSVTDTYPVDNRGFPLGMIPSARTFNFARHIDVHTLTAIADGTVYVTVQGPVTASVSVTTSASTARFTFDLTSLARISSDVTRLFTHLYEPGDSFPPGSPQRTVPVPPAATRPQMTISGSIANPPSTNQLWFKLLDPPDTSAYIPLAAQTPGDNRDPIPPVLMTEDGAQKVNVGQPLKVSWAGGNVVRLVLEGSDHVAGDNYTVIASFEPPDSSNTFPCEQPTAVACSESPIITVWKRFYLELHGMLKQGSWLSRAASVGDTDLFVRDMHGFHNGDTVDIMHARSSTVGDDFLGETHRINVVPADRTTGVPAHLHISDGSSLAINYTFNPDPTLFLSDGVGVDSGTDRYFPEFGALDPLTLLDPVQAYFASMFVDLQEVGTTSPIVPFYDHIHDDGPDSDALHFVQHWTRGVALPNHRALFAAAHSSDTSLGVCLLPQFAYSLVYQQTIAEQVRDGVGMLRHLDPTVVSWEATTHELTHQWRVNLNPVPAGGDGFGHCAANTFDDSGLFCHMHTLWADPHHDGERGDGLMKLHYVTPPASGDSEYLTIRTAIEPMP